MPTTWELTRFIVALFTSGIFWLMFLFYGEKAWHRGGLAGAKYMGVVVLVLSGVLFFKVVVNDAAWKNPPDLMSLSDTDPGF
jgi:hypothetical protein